MRTGRLGLHALLEFQLETCQERTGCEDRYDSFTCSFGISVGDLSGENRR